MSVANRDRLGDDVSYVDDDALGARFGLMHEMDEHDERL